VTQNNLVLNSLFLSTFTTLQATPVASALSARAHLVGPAGVIFLHSATVVEECILRSLVAALSFRSFSGGQTTAFAGCALAVVFATSADLFLARVGIIVDHCKQHDYHGNFRNNAPMLL